MLYLIGTGIHDYRDLSINGMDILKKMDSIFFESYTSSQDINLKKLEKEIGKKIEILNREDVENSNILFQKNKNIALLVVGDPLSATTHNQIIIDAKKKRIKTKVIHSSSIFSAIGETGLHLYKFGKTISIPFVREDFVPKSPCELIEQNRSINAHTLVLLDIGMKSKQAIDYLLSICNLKEDTKAIVCADLGGENRIFSGTLKTLKKKDIDILPQTIVLPSNMHFTEKESFDSFKV